MLEDLRGVLRGLAERVTRAFEEFAGPEAGRSREFGQVIGETVADLENADEIAAHRLATADEAHTAIRSTAQLPGQTAGIVRKIPDLSSMPPVRDLLEVDSPNNDRLREQLAGFEQQYGPYRLKIYDAFYASTTGSVQEGSPVDGFGYFAEIIGKDDKGVGELSRMIYKDEGRIVVNNWNMLLDPQARGQGFSTAFGTAMENYYRRSGIDRMLVTAAGEDGGYAWARAGYDFNPKYLSDSVSKIKERIQLIRDQLSPADQQQLERIMARFEGPVTGYPSPAELADLTGGDPQLGKTLMRGTTWYGMRVL
ncbi:hypothetical protein ACQP1G_25970 [Nocardia sp. CA-107356]|uniref:hypothetical protein n=1 Tax=Nocardia sp. CA-107356 TaxID=3239972 RepID=UPI003D8C0B58